MRFDNLIAKTEKEFQTNFYFTKQKKLCCLQGLKFFSIKLFQVLKIDIKIYHEKDIANIHSSKANLLTVTNLINRPLLSTTVATVCFDLYQFLYQLKVGEGFDQHVWTFHFCDFKVDI